VTESGLAEYVDSLHTAGLELHYRAHFPEIHLTAVGSDSQTLDALDGHLRDRFSLKHFGGADAHFPAVVNDVLRKRNWTLATAESCTGGLISQLITSVAGSSDVFEYGAVTYGNTAKSVALGVPADLIATHGAVSQPVAEKMAMGARDRACADVGLAVTGIAGPGGGTEEKPVGTVHLAVASEDGITHRKLFYPYDRARIRLITAYTALLLVRKICMRGMIHGEKSEHSEGH
jgi:nicotinamide-nucleotide amidase